MHKIKRSLIVILIVLTFISCPGKTGDRVARDNDFMLYVFMCASSYSHKDETLFEDMKDGTIKRTERSTTVTSSPAICFGAGVRDKNISYIKKCLQGQVYRSAQNDCQGTGTAPDWGAVKYQFCATNDRACDMQTTNSSGSTIYVADPTKSPAAISCDQDTTAGKKWKLVREIGLYPETYIFPVNIASYMPEIPKGSTNLIWTDFAWTSNVDKTDVYYFDVSTGSEKSQGSQLKNSTQYVLCISK